MDETKKQLLTQCLEKHYEEILNFMYLRLYNRYDAEDMTQNAFLQIIQSIDNYRGEASLRTWAFQIARNTLINGYRQKNSLKRLLDRLRDQMAFQKNEQPPHETIELFSLLDSLEKRDSELLILKHYFGFTYEEISNITGLTSSNVGVRLKRAIQTLNHDFEGGVDVGQQKSRKPL